MKHIIEKGSFKTSMYIFIGTGLFLIGLFSYQLYDKLQVSDFNYEFPGDWDKLIGIIIGVYLIFRSQVFKVRSRDLFIEVNSDQLKYRLNKEESIHQIKRSNISDIKIKKGKIEVVLTNSSSNITIDLNSFRLKDEQRNQIVTSFNQLS